MSMEKRDAYLVTREKKEQTKKEEKKRKRQGKKKKKDNEMRQGCACMLLERKEIEKLASHSLADTKDYNAHNLARTRTRVRARRRQPLIF